MAAATAGFAFTVVIPTAISMTLPTLEPMVGWSVIATSATIGLPCLIWSALPTSLLSRGTTTISKGLGGSGAYVSLPDAPFVVGDLAGIGPNVNLRPKSFLNDFLAGGHVDAPTDYPGARKNLSVPAMRNLDGHEFVECEVDWAKRCFRWTWAHQRSGTWFRSGFSMQPWQTEQASQPDFARVSADVWDQMMQRARFVWALMKEPVDELIASGLITVWGRLGSTFAEYRRVAPDTWRHFKVTDWLNGVATASSGETLYSVRLELGPRLLERPKRLGLLKSGRQSQKLHS